ncbi:NnrU family protein [Marinomonas ostreistagni]|uniref:NnrU family protein n=1 Tax=Marinomonas ostreistagni TaxID=359209 RepID=UPI00194FBEE6|nr:NnrU family protein [Marinomonas ostreistagni]MBM6549530.1 NnrU family protein [Marinomonas ostreistagni]
MALLLVGLLLFIGIHSLRLFANEWRESMIEQLGKKNWQLLHAAVAIIGLLTIIMGYGYARYSAEWLWFPPVWTRHLAALLVLLAFVFVAAAAMPYSKLKSWVSYPMALGIKLWAFAHLISNGTSADVVLFGAFLAWAICNYAISRRRARAQGLEFSAPNFKFDALAIIVALAAYAVFVLFLHEFLIGVAPLPM